MADILGTIASSPTVGAQRTAATAAASKPQTEESSSRSQVQPVSPTLRVDPIAGVVITEYFNSSGEVQTQLPSKASVAYMRMGLSPTGLPRAKDDAASVATEA